MRFPSSSYSDYLHYCDLLLISLYSFYPLLLRKMITTPAPTPLTADALATHNASHVSPVSTRPFDERAMPHLLTSVTGR